MALTKVTNSMIVGTVVNVQDFGAKGDGITPDTLAIQAAIDHYATLIGGDDSTSAGYAGFFYPELVFPAGTYVCGEVNLPAKIRVRSEGQAVIQSATGTSGTPAGYWSNDLVQQGYVDGVTFLYFNTVLRWLTNNADFSHHFLKNCSVSHCNLLLDQVSYNDSRSTFTVIDNLFVSYGVNQVAKIYSDKSEIRNCWLIHSSDSYLFELDSFCLFENNLLVPVGTDKTNRAVIYFKASDSARSLVVDSCRFGGEDGQSAIVVVGEVNYPNINSNVYRNQGVTIRRCEMNSNGNYNPDGYGAVNACVVLRETSSPNYSINFLSFQDCYGGPDKSGGIVQFYGSGAAKDSFLSDFSITMDEGTAYSAIRGVNKPCSADLERFLCLPVLKKYTNGQTLGTGKLTPVATATSGEFKATFTVDLLFPTSNVPPMQFLVLLEGQSANPYPSTAYAATGAYILTITGYYNGSSSLAEISYTKLHSMGGGISRTSTSEIVSAHWGTGDTGAATYTLSSTPGANDNLSVTIAFGALLGASSAIYVRPLYDFSLLT